MATQKIHIGFLGPIMGVKLFKDLTNILTYVRNGTKILSSILLSM